MDLNPPTKKRKYMPYPLDPLSGLKTNKEFSSFTLKNCKIHSFWPKTLDSDLEIRSFRPKTADFGQNLQKKVWNHEV